MKKYICLIFLMGLFACQEEELVRYTQEKDALQFSSSEERKLEYNFAMAYEEVKKQEGVVNRYLGDSLKEKTFVVILELQGFPSPDERAYQLKTVLLEDQDSSKVAKVVFEPYYSLSPNQLKDTIQFTVFRPEARGTYRLGLMVETEGEAAFFEKGAEECAVFSLDIQDRYEEPEDWKYRTEWLGEFNEEKYAFMVTTSGKLFNRHDNYMWNQTEKYNMELRRLLQEYNDAHSQAKKDFEFPVTSKMVWWDNQQKYLGEYSEEKYAFIHEVMRMYSKEEDEELDQSSKLEYWNLVCRLEAEKQGRTDIVFPRITQQSFWWKETALGSFSVEKQEFVILNLFPISLYQITENTWNYGNVMLRAALKKYMEENPEAVVNFDFPVEGYPEWWNVREKMLGEYSEAKRDLVVEVVFDAEYKYGNLGSIDPLLNPNRPFEDCMNAIRQAAANYNTAHPDQPIVFPVVGPTWWDTNLLGDFSAEKDDFIRSILSKWGGWYGEWAKWELVWNPVLRYELDQHNTANPDARLEIEFPVVDVKWPFWDRLGYLGEYSEAKKLFIIWVLEDWKRGDEWAFETYARDIYDQLINAYQEYNAKHTEPLPFTFPDTFPN